MDKFILYHVGGASTKIGPASNLYKLKDKLELYFFEASVDSEEEENYKKLVKRMKRKFGIDVFFIPFGLFDAEREVDFYVNVDRASSSFFRVNDEAKDYLFMEKKLKWVWGEACKAETSFPLKVSSVDVLCDKGEIKAPDFISMDVQASEYCILEGAVNSLEDTVGLSTEADFRAIYKEQKPFADIYKFLADRHFVLYNFYETQYWYDKVIFGKPFRAVSEAVFFRDYNYFIEKYKEDKTKVVKMLIKLAMSAYAFNNLSYVYKVMDVINKEFSDEYKNMGSEHGYLDKIYKRGESLYQEQSLLPSFVKRKCRK